VQDSIVGKEMIDFHGRKIHKLRVQLTDACNFRCLYCMPLNAKFLPSSEHLKAKELLDICSNLVDFGINEMRVSGGEPTIREDFDEIIEGLSSLNLLKLGITTNAYYLSDKLTFLKGTKAQHINISCDSLNKKQFQLITRTDHFETVYGAILKAQSMGFKIKVNMVLLRGMNDDEVFDFIDFSSKYQIEVRFLELMKIGPFHARHKELFVPAQEIIAKIEEREKLTPVSVNCDSTSFNFHTSSGGRIGFIASESQPFCDFCSRLRLTSKGKLRACIMSEAGISLKNVAKDNYPYILK